jgi:hypothetical protein
MGDGVGAQGRPRRVCCRTIENSKCVFGPEKSRCGGRDGVSGVGCHVWQATAHPARAWEQKDNLQAPQLHTPLTTHSCHRRVGGASAPPKLPAPLVTAKHPDCRALKPHSPNPTHPRTSANQAAMRAECTAPPSATAKEGRAVPAGWGPSPAEHPPLRLRCSAVATIASARAAMSCRPYARSLAPSPTGCVPPPRSSSKPRLRVPLAAAPGESPAAPEGM